MKHKCYISFKWEDRAYKEYMQNELAINMIDKSLSVEIDSTNEDYIMRKIREEYIADSTVTIFLIGSKSAESLGWQEQRFIKRELQASLYNGNGNSRSGILGIVLPNMYDRVYTGNCACACGKVMNSIDVSNTTISEFSYNYFIPNGKCHWQEDDRYCVLVKWSDFINEPEKYIDKAFDKRSNSITDKVKVRP